MKTLVLALGNPILSDDGVAYKVANRLAKHLNPSYIMSSSPRTKTDTHHDVHNMQYDIIKSSAATMDIIPQLTGYDRLAVIDAVQLGSVPIGTVHRFSLEELAETVRISSPHDINFATALQIGKGWGYNIPEDIRIYGIEVKELLTFSEDCTPEVTQKLDEIVEHILNDLTN